MDAQELRDLQEAYMEVYDNELSEGYKKFPYKKVEDKIHKKEEESIVTGKQIGRAHV